MPGRVLLPQPLQGWSEHSEVPAGLSLLLLVDKGALLCSGRNFKLPGEGSPADPVTQGLACSVPPGLRVKAPAARHVARGHSPPRLTLGPMAEHSLLGDAAACRDSADSLGELGSSTHLLSVQYLVFCKSRVQ